MDVPPLDPTCPICSKPITSGSLVLLDHGELFHLGCRSQTLELAAMEEVADARATRTQAIRLRVKAKRRRANREQAAHLIESIRRQPVARTRPAGATRQPAQVGRCPFCGGPATLTDWRPGLEWMVVEGCRCHGFFIWAGLVTERLASLSGADRADLARRIHTFRAMGYEAWCTTTDGTTQGPLIVRTARPA